MYGALPLVVYQLMKSLPPVEFLFVQCAAAGPPKLKTICISSFSAILPRKVWAGLFDFLWFNFATASSTLGAIFGYLSSLHLSLVVGNLSRYIFMAALWEIWFSRNRARFEGQPMNSRHILNWVMLVVRSLATYCKFRGGTINNAQRHWLTSWGVSPMFVEHGLPRIICWLPPHPSGLKLNVNGALKRDVGAAGGGGCSSGLS